MPAPPVIALDTAGQAAGGTPSELVEAIAGACANIGFFVLTDHGLEHQIDRVFAAAHGLFALPEPTKESLAMVDRQGFVPARHRVIDTSIHSAPAEYYDVGSSTPVGSRRYPSEEDLPGFVAVVEKYQQAVLAASSDVLRLIAIGLDLPPGFFADRMQSPHCFLRMMHYEPSGEADGTILTDPHTDYGLITLLATDGVGGLEVRQRDGTWSPVVAPPRSLIVNLGDTLARWTNDKYVSTPHRVSAPAGRDRFSVPFFVNPDRDTVVSCLPSCVDDQHPCRYQPVTAGEFLAERIAQGGYMNDDPDHGT